MFSIRSAEKLMNNNSENEKRLNSVFLNLANSWGTKINPESPQFLPSKTEEI